MSHTFIYTILGFLLLAVSGFFIFESHNTAEGALTEITEQFEVLEETLAQTEQTAASGELDPYRAEEVRATLLQQFADVATTTETVQTSGLTNTQEAELEGNIEELETMFANYHELLQLVDETAAELPEADNSDDIPQEYRGEPIEQVTSELVENMTKRVTETPTSSEPTELNNSNSNDLTL